MERNKTDLKRKLICGILTLLTSAFLMIIPGVYLRSSLGLAGTVITEVLFVIVSVLFLKLFGFDIKDALEIKPPGKKTILPSILIYIGAFALTIVISSLTEMLFGEDTGYTNNVNALLGSSSPVLEVVSLALVPAVCEEILFRGAIRHCHSFIPVFVIRVLLNGLLFGLFHMSLSRLIPISVLGAALAFAAEYTGSIAVGMVLHMFNNLIPLSAFFLTKSGSTGIEGDSAAVIIICSVLSVVFLTSGILIASRRKLKRAKK